MLLGPAPAFELPMWVADMTCFIIQYMVSTMSVNDGVASRYGERL
jgi:hypothetical protein